MPRLVEGFAIRMRVPAGKRDVTVFDDALPGFGIRKFASGKASYIVKYVAGTTQRKLSLGPAVPGTLSEKRRRASEILTRARAGQDVVAEKQVAKIKNKVTLGGLVPLYLDTKHDVFRPAHSQSDGDSFTTANVRIDVRARSVGNKRTIRTPPAPPCSAARILPRQHPYYRSGNCNMWRN